MIDTTKQQDMDLWNEYKISHNPVVRDKLLNKVSGLIQSQVNKWSGNIPVEVLKNEAAMLATKAFDTYDPSKGVALSTHIVNNLAPLSRIVYTYANSARVPENIVLKINTYNQALEHLVTLYGRQPTLGELHDHTGFNSKELSKLQTMSGKDLIESSGNLGGTFFSAKDDADADSMFAIYNSLLPDEKILFEYVTGYFSHIKMSNTQIMEKLNLSQAQLSYKKTQLARKLESLINGKHKHK